MRIKTAAPAKSRTSLYFVHLFIFGTVYCLYSKHYSLARLLFGVATIIAGNPTNMRAIGASASVPVSSEVALLTKENLRTVASGHDADDDKSDGGDSADDKRSDAGSESSSDTDSSASSELQKGSALHKAVRTAGKVGKEFKKLFINYGPPYRKYRGPDDIATALLQDTLLNECCKPEAYLTEIHRFDKSCRFSLVM